jgi:hypothetical protein
MSIGVGETTTLTWSSTNADTVTIDNGIGEVSPSGSLEQVLNDTTTYIITATGPGGTITESVTVTVIKPLPTVNLNASPVLIMGGDPVTLTWTSTYADTCSIEPNIGEVENNGSIAVSPTETTDYIITVTNSSGTASANVLVEVTSPIELNITSPIHGSNVSGSDIIVEGTFSNLKGFETGITVNGSLAMVYGNQFIANNITLEEGENTITVIGVDSFGNVNKYEITIYADTSAADIRLRSIPQVSLSPLETTLKVLGTINIVSSSISCSDPAALEILQENIVEYKIRVTGEGYYYLTVDAEDSEGNTYSDTYVVMLRNRTQLDTLLTNKWNEMKASLATGNIEDALTKFNSSSADRYGTIFETLSTHLPQIVSSMQDIELIYSIDHISKYRIVRNQLVDGTHMDITYHIFFTKDATGLWKIDKF